ncbi:MAG: hypothetical protein GY696_17405, partial [Gammaproteobacteria bacterium]|nr:hypothetical protein [Gammaproteobacteria bacterium]
MGEQRTTVARREEKSLMRNQMITPDYGDPDDSDPGPDSEGSSDEKRKPVFRKPVKPRTPMKPKKVVCAPVPYEDSSDESELDWLPEEDDEISDGGRAARRWAGPFMQVVGVYDPRKDKTHEFRSWRDKFRGQAEIFRLSQRDQFSMLDTLLIGPAKEEIRACRIAKMDIKKTLASLANSFSPRKSCETYLGEAQALRQRDDQTVHQYGTEVISKLRRAYPRYKGRTNESLDQNFLMY